MNAIRVSILAAALLSACAGQKKAAGPTDISVRVDQLLPQNKSLDASAIAVKLELFNPRADGVTIDKIDYQIDTGEVSGVLKGSSDGGATLESQQTAELEFEQSIPFPEDRAAYQQVLEKGTIPVNVTGTVHFEDGSSSDFERQGSVATPSLPKFIVYDAQAARYGGEGLEVTFFLRLVNENVFSVTIEQVEYAVAINGKELKNETGGIGTRLPSGAGQEFEVSVILDPKTFPEVKTILSEGRLDYTVTAKVNVAGLELPFEFSKPIELGSGEED
jgi:LEA14-like dessication related protein